MTDIATGAQIATATAALDPTLIGFWQFGMWETEQDMTIENFKVLYKGANLPTPASGATLVPVDQVLSWMAPNDPNVVSVAGYDVYIDPNMTLVANGDASVKSSEASASHTPAANLEFGTTYYWRVDSSVNYDYNAGGDPNLVEGGIWSFTTEPATPTIATLDNIFTSMSLLPATISATVVDGDGDLASIAWEVLADDVLYPEGAIAEITDTTTDLYNPTASFTTDVPGYYRVRLTVTDALSASESKVFEVRVEETACDQAKVGLHGAWPANIFDTNSDCVVDLNDFAAFAAEWLDNTASTEQELWTGDVVYIPITNGIPNGNFETGNFVGWSSASWDMAEVIDTPADVYEGSYAAWLENTLKGVVCGPIDLPVGNHTITLQYKGDLTALSCGFQDNLTTAAVEITSPTDIESLASGTVPSYTQYTVEFTVTAEGAGAFKVWGRGDNGSGFVDDFRLILNSH
jgi:hypothetical protein